MLYIGCLIILDGKNIKKTVLEISIFELSRQGCPYRKKTKKNPVRYGVISKEPADSTCLHPGVPNCSTMSP